MRKILLSGLRKSDELVITSLLSMLSNDTGEKWDITTTGNSDIAVVDVDDSNGLSMAHNLELVGSQVIRLSANAKNKDQGVWLHKPVRSAEILKCFTLLNQLKEKESGTQDPLIDGSSVIRLRRWPNRHAMKEFPNINRLCAILIRQPLTINRAVEISELSHDEMMLFIKKVRKNNCLQVGTNETDVQGLTKNTASTNSTLFSRLRKKLTGKA